jgi:hypothetical protein
MVFGLAHRLADVMRLLPRSRGELRARLSGAWASAASPLRMDLRSLAALRMALGFTLLVDLSIRSRDLAAHYGMAGIYKCTSFAALKAPWHWDMFPCQASEWFVRGHFLVHALCASFLFIGLQTRLASLACWLLLLSLHNRDPLVLNGGDSLFRLVMMWSVFLPLGARWSLDERRLLRVHTGATVLSAGTIAYCLQVLIVYPLVIWARRNDASWWNGSALMQIVDYDLYATRFGIALRKLPLLLKLSNHGTMFWELWGPLFALLPVFGRGWLRTLVVFTFLGLHLGIGVVVNVGTFPLICASAWLGFLPSGFWDFLFPGSAVPVHARALARRYRVRFEFVLANVLAALLFTYTLSWNTQRMKVHVLDPLFPKPVTWLGHALRVDQSWQLFSSPPRNDGWFILVAYLADGERIDLLRGGAAISFKKPDYVLGDIPSRRWGKLLMQLKRKEYKSHRSRFLDHYARVWNERAPCTRQIKRTELVFMPERAHGEVNKRVLWYLTPHSQRPECAIQMTTADL